MKTIIFIILLTVTTLILNACSKDGSAQEAGRAIDSKVEKIGEVVEVDSKAIGDYIDDTIITVNAKAALLAHTDLKSLGISIETLEGVATLKGEVPSSAEKEKAGVLIEGIGGVKNVKNELQVKSAK